MRKYGFLLFDGVKRWNSVKNHAILQYRDGVLLANMVATATHADLISISRFWRFHNLFVLTL